MSDQRAEWSKFIRKLLDRHGLTDRAAAAKVGRPSLRTSIGEWKRGHIPTYKTTIDFLEHFPKDEAAEGLKAAGYLAPESCSTLEQSQKAKPSKEDLIGYLKTNNHLSKQDMEEIKKEIDLLMESRKNNE